MRPAAMWIVLLGVLSGSSISQEQRDTTRSRGSNRVPTLKSVGPAAARRGTQSTWRVSGTNLTAVKRWLVSGEGVDVVTAKPAAEGEVEVRVTVSETAALGYRELRALANEGLSNFRVVRIDTLHEREEAEPNDTQSQAQPISPGEAVSATLKEREYDYFKIHLPAERPFVIDVEAQRLGQPVRPVLTLFDSAGNALNQATETRGLAHDARLAFVTSSEGDYVLLVRDALFAGGESVRYRLRVEEGPVATGLFPLGARRGDTITLEASGGNLAAPLLRSFEVPADASPLLDPPAFDGPAGSVRVPMRLAISDGPSVCESQDSQTVKGMSIPVGTIVHGRVARPGEVDRYRVTVEKAKALSLRVQAGAMGSWLDSVVRVVDEKGATVAENDDVGVNNNVNINPFNSQPAESSDSRVEFTPRESGDLMIEVTDRYGAGGPEFGYQLQLGTSAPDFELSLLFGDPGLARRRLFGQPQQTPRGPGANGAINIKPGTSVPINFLVSSDGRIGKVEVRAEGLPEGVTAAPVTVNLAVGPKGRPPTPSSSGGALVLKAAPTARAVLGELRIVGTARIEANAAPIVRRGTARVLVDLGTPANGPNAPPLASWELAQLPVWVAGRIEDSSTGAARPEPVSLSGAEIPGVLLQGATIEIPLRLDPAVPPTGSYELTAESLTPRITAHTVVTENSADVTASPARVKVSAAADAPVGVANVTLRLTSGGKESVKDVPVIVRPPATLSVAPRLRSTADGKTRLQVVIDRQPGLNGPVELRLKLPPGVEAVEEGPWRTEGKVLELELKGSPIAESGQTTPPVIEIQGLARMPRGMVSIPCPIRPMFCDPRADESDDTATNKSPRSDVRPEGGL